MNSSARYLRMYLHVPEGGRLAIGYLSQHGNNLRASFDADYVEDSNRPLLSLGFTGVNDEATREIMTSTNDVRMARSDGKWPAYFENLLPEAHNRDRLARLSGCSPNDEFALLAAAGSDLVGSLEVEQVRATDEIPDDVLRVHTPLYLELLEPGLNDLSFEYAAANPGDATIFSALKNKDRYIAGIHELAGDTILKLPSTAHPELVENEYTCYQLCEAVGLECAEASVISKNDADLPEQAVFEKILAVKRFDRGEGGRRIHFEEFAQVLQYSPKHKYGSDINQDFVKMVNLINTLSPDPVHDVRQFVGRFVAFILLGNTDAHLKKWGLLYPDGRTPRLAPVYDPVCVSSFFESAPRNQYSSKRATDKALREFSWKDLESLLSRANLLRPGSYVRVAKQLVKQAQSEWPSILSNGPSAVSRSVRERLAGGVALTA